MGTVAGEVVGLARWPVKSIGGEAPAEVDAVARGLAGDRAYAVWPAEDGAQRPLTAREAPTLLRWSAAYPAPAVVTGPEGRRFAAGDAGLVPALEAALGRPVQLRRDAGGQQDIPGTVLVTVEGSRRDAEAVLERPLDLRRFRTNVHLELDAPAWEEELWSGATLEVEDGPVMELLHPCIRCVLPTRNPDTGAKWPQLARWLTRAHGNLFGLNARVVRPGVLREGAAVRVQGAGVRGRWAASDSNRDLRA